MTIRRILLRPFGYGLPAVGLALLAGGCGNGPGPEPTTGSVRVSVQTTGQALDPDGYTVTVGGTTRFVDVNGQVIVDSLQKGAVNVELADVASNCDVGGANPRTVTVEVGQTVDATFQVACVALGAVQVSVTTTGVDPDPNGYTVTVGGNVRSLEINGQVTVSGLATGPISVALSAVASNCTVGGSNPRSITVVVDTTVTTAFDVTCVLSAWHAVAPMPTGRLGLATAVVGGYVYAIGGYAAATAPGLTTVERYDPATNQWSTQAEMPSGRRWLSAAAVNGKIYAIGGHSGESAPGLPTVEEYDPAMDSWATKADMPTARLGAPAAVVDGVIYVMGGGRGDNTGPVKTVEAYDPATDSWSSKADMPTARVLMALEVVGGKIYAIGGGADPATGTTLVEVYDPAADAWTSGADMRHARSALCGAMVGDRIYAIGGAVGGFSNIMGQAAVEAYDPATDSWIGKADMPTPRWGLACAEVNGKIYAIGGAFGGVPHPGLGTVEEFDPSVP